MSDTFNRNGTQADGRQKRCSVCGELLEADARFCENCGTPVEKDPIPVPEQKAGSKALLYLAVGCGVVLVVSYLLIFFLGGKFAKEDPNQGIQSSVFQETDGLFSRDEEEDAELPETDTEDAAEKEETGQKEESSSDTDIDADIDAVHNRSCTVSGSLFYTDNMEAPVLVLGKAVSLYVNSTAGEQVYYGAVTQISFGSYSIGEKKLKKYNNVEVDVTGSLWAENDIIYIDVQELLGELPETEKETETETEAEEDYILPESNSKYLTETDVAGLSLKEINYAKNEIYARHRRKFDSPELQRYFGSKTWYKAEIDPYDFSTNVFNSYERKNVQFLAQKEESMQKGGYKLDQ